MTDMARELGVSRQALSKRMEKDGIDLAFIRDPQTKQLTEAGITYFRQAYAHKANARKASEEAHVAMDAETQPVVSTTQPRNSLEEMLRESTARCRILEEQNRNLANQIDELKLQLQEVKQDARAEQERSHQELMAVMSRIPLAPALPDPKDRGIRAWWRRRHEKKPE